MNSEYSLVSCDKDNVIMETVKMAEYSDEVVVRLYDCKNIRTKTNITFGFDITEAYLSNLSERKLKKLNIKDNSVSIEVKPFEIVTLIVK